MGEGITHIISPLTAPWCSWTMLGLMLLAILSEWLQPGVITQAASSLTVRMERTYKDAPTNLLAQTLITLFRIGTLAMALCLCLAEGNQFSFWAYLAVNGVIFGVALIKMLGNVLLDYTFQLQRSYGEAYEHFSNMYTLTAVVMFPFVLIFIHIDSIIATRWLLGIFVAIFIILWLYRFAQQFVRKPLAILYLIAYAATLEIIPIVAVAYLSAKTISIL